MERLCLLLLLLPPLGAPACPNCLPAPDTDRIRLEAIKHQILMKLGLRHKPNVTQPLPRALVLDTLLRAEEHRGFLGDAESREEAAHTTPLAHDQDFDDFYGRTSEIITFAEQGQSLNSNKLLEFRMAREPDGASGQQLRVRQATLWLKVELRSHHQQQHAGCVPTIWVFHVKEPLREDAGWLRGDEFDRVTQLAGSRALAPAELGWVQLELTRTVRSWYAQPARAALRLLVDCSGCCGPVRVHTAAGPERPFLVLQPEPGSGRRVRRRALDCSGALRNQCCKQRFYVSFKELGWDDWVIAPSGYYANYCRGECGAHRTPDSFLNYYSHIIDEIRKKHQLSGMQPCCAPLKFSSMSLIYFGPDSNIIKRDLPKMVVDECGCP